MILFLLFVVLVLVALLVVFTTKMARSVDQISTELQSVSRRLRSMEQPPVAAKMEPKPESEVAPVPVPVPAPEPEPVVETPIEVLLTPPPIPQMAAAVVPAAPKTPTAFVRFFTEHTLAKLGIITLILGVGFFVKYAIDQHWINELFRVCIGLVVGGALLGLAHRLHKNYAVFSSLLSGGGVAVFYLTIALAFGSYALVSQWTAFCLLVLVTGLSVFLSFYYNRKELAIVALVGGFIAPLFVGLEREHYAVLFTYLLLLNSGMLAVSYRKKWFIIGLLAFVGTNVLLWLWLWEYAEIAQIRAAMLDWSLGDKSFATPMFAWHTGSERIGIALFVAAFYAQFCALVWWDMLREVAHRAWNSVGLLLTHNVASFLVMSYLFRGDSEWVALGYAVVNGLAVWALYGVRTRFAQLYYIVLGLCLSFASLFVPMVFDGQAVTLCWVVESVLLIWLWRKSQVKVFAWGFMVLTALSFCSYQHDLVQASRVMPLLVNPLFLTGAALAVATWLGYGLLRKGDRTEGVCLWGQGAWFRLDVLQRVWLGLGLFYAFVAPFAEIKIQAHEHCMVLSDWLGFGYVFVYGAVVSFCYIRKKGHTQFLSILSLIGLGFYVLVYVPWSYRIGTSIYLSETPLVQGVYWAHWLVFASAGVIGWWLWRDLPQCYRDTRSLVVVLLLMGVVSITATIDHTVLSLGAARWGVWQVRETMDSVVHPILWALMASGLMVWGLQRDAWLRKIALVFFLLIIARFYLYDVWQMSQAGRIISFVALGLILLVVSFLQQKIKRLIK